MWAVSNQLLDRVKVLADVVVADVDVAFSWLNLASQALKCGRFSSTIDTKKSEALASLQAKRDVLNSNQWLDRIAAAAINLVHFAEVLNLDLELVVRCLSNAIRFSDHILVKLQVILLFGHGLAAAAVVCFTAALAKVSLDQEQD